MPPPIALSNRDVFGRSPPNIPVVSVPEDVAVNIALSLRYQINRGFAALRDIALGRDLKKFLAVCCVAYLTMEFRILVHCFGYIMAGT